MRDSRTLIVFGPLLLAAACSPSSVPTTAPGVVGPHRGVVLPLPDRPGFAEVVYEPAGKKAGGTRDLVAVYFLGDDAKAPLSPRPSDVALDLTLAESRTRKSFPLAPIPREGDPASPSRFAAPSPEGFDGNLGGKLNFKLDGKDVSLSF